MTPEAQRIVIAEACGWKDIDWVQGGPSGIILMGNTREIHFPKRAQRTHEKEVPDYLNDLNAMHEAEMKYIYPSSELSNAYVLRIGPFSTAAQRAEAFVKTIEKWDYDAS
jgi:hypothetical protein